MPRGTKGPPSEPLRADNLNAAVKNAATKGDDQASVWRAKWSSTPFGKRRLRPR